MARATLFIMVSCAALGCCAQAFALSATATTSVQIVQPAGISLVTPLIMPTVTTTAVSATSGLAGVTTSTGSTGTTAGNPATSDTSAGNATLTIHGQAGDAVSMAVPESFTVVRTGGTEALTVKTNTNAEFGLSDGVVLGGAVLGSSTMSVNVGGAISLASSDRAAPGAYEGLLVVVVQYN